MKFDLYFYAEGKGMKMRIMDLAKLMGKLPEDVRRRVQPAMGIMIRCMRDMQHVRDGTLGSDGFQTVWGGTPEEFEEKYLELKEGIGAGEESLKQVHACVHWFMAKIEDAQERAKAEKVQEGT